MDNVKTVKLLNFNVYVQLLEDDADEFMFEDSSVDMKELNGGAVHLRNEKGQEGCVPDSGQKKRVSHLRLLSMSAGTASGSSMISLLKVRNGDQ